MTGPDIEAARAARRYAGPILFEYGFRPFFLGAGLQALLAMATWTAWLIIDRLDPGAGGLHIAMPASFWHAHEMIFGYATAVIAGFFLTAVPGWTGRQPVRGALLAVLFGLWLAARLVSWLSAPLPLPPAAFAVPELAFLALLGVLVGRALLAGASRRNFVFLPVLVVLFAAALLCHLDYSGVLPSGARVGHLLALDAILVLIAVVGGRIVPAFTANALRREGAARLPRPTDRRDVAAILLVAALALFDLVAPGSVATGWVALAAGAASALRMAGWRSASVLGAPILWILHLGYAWFAAGLLLKGAALTIGAFPEVSALHALTVGAVGSMTIGVMSRAALGHTGRPLQVTVGITLSYLMVSLAAITRVAGPLALPDRYAEAMLLSGLFWCSAFLIFTVTYWPVLTRPRLSQQLQ